MRVVICGARGSAPTSGPEFNRYGGNTSCVAIAHDEEDTTLILDAGTGLRRASKLLGGRPFRGTIVLGHLHWDHTQGLPFFDAAEHPESRVRVLIPAQGEPKEVLARSMSPPHFPLRPEELRGDWEFATIEEGVSRLEGFSVLALPVPHGGGRSLAYRVTDGQVTMTYLSDHGPIALGPGLEGLGPYHRHAVTLASDTDLLIHDAQHTAAEFPAKSFLGHSAVEYAVGLAQRCRAKRLLLFHHDPDRTDTELDGIVAAHNDGALQVEAAKEGQTLDLG